MLKKNISDRAVEFILTRRIEELKNLTVEKIAQRIGVNRFYLSLSFLIGRKISLPNFILREKMHEAFFILEKDQRIPLDELSRKLGFMRFEDFNMEFEKYFAISPGRFRDIRSGISC